MAATEWKVGLAEAIAAWEKETGGKWDYETPIPDKYYISKRPTLFFVKDSGIYLMAGAKMAEFPKDMSHVCYAAGYEPTAKNSWEKCRKAVGGDDFVETIILSANIQNSILAGGNIIIDITEEKFSLTVSMPRPNPKVN